MPPPPAPPTTPAPTDGDVVDVAFVQPFIASMVRVCKQTASVECIVGQPYRKRDGHRMHLLYSHAAAIQFSGGATGLLSLDFAAPLAVSLASAFAGQPFDRVDHPDCTDALAELLNIVAGAAKREMAAAGQVSLSIGYVSRTQQLRYPAGVPILVIPFDTSRGRLVMEVALRRTATAAAA